MIIVDVALATICFLGSCYPALVGKETPRGEFPLINRIVLSPGYGGDVLQFKETEIDVYSIHRVWLGNPAQYRLKRLNSKNIKNRIITDGCINVDSEVYEKLKSCCSADLLLVR